MKVVERSAAYLYEAEIKSALATSFDLLATAPGGTDKLRELILSLAVRGKLVEQCSDDEPADVLMREIEKEKQRLVGAGQLKGERAYSDFDENDLPYALPLGWRWVRLGELLIKIGAGSTPRGGREVYTKTGVKFLRSQNIWNGGLALDGVAHISQSIHERMSGTKVVAGDLLFNITGASIGRCALVPDTFDEANVSQHVAILRAAIPGIRKFLHLVAISPRVQQTVMDVQVGVSREGLSVGKLRQFAIPLPPLAEQARIVARVEELMQLCDALEAQGRLQDEQHARLVATLFDALAASESAHALAENWQRIAAHFDLLLDRPEAVDALEQTILQLAVRGLLVPQNAADEPAGELLAHIRSEAERLDSSGEIKRKKSKADIGSDGQPFELPPSWEWVAFDDVVRPDKPIAYGVLVPGPDLVDGVPFVRLADISLTNPPAKPAKHISPDVDALFERTRLEGGEILLGVVGSIGKLGVAPTSWRGANIARAICRVVPTPLVDKQFVIYLLQSDFMQKRFKGDTRTLAQPTLNVGLIRSCPVPLPPLAEQRRIVARIDQLNSLCADLRERLQQSRTTQSHLADALVCAATQSPAC